MNSHNIPEVSSHLNTEEAARYLRLAASTLNKMRLTGGGPTFIKLGPRRVVYSMADLNRWLGARRRRSTAEYSLSGGDDHAQ